eukprot:5072924-Ditylum_brightwellii.AAC.1
MLSGSLPVSLRLVKADVPRAKPCNKMQNNINKMQNYINKMRNNMNKKQNNINKKQNNSR